MRYAVIASNNKKTQICPNMNKTTYSRQGYWNLYSTAIVQSTTTQSMCFVQLTRHTDNFRLGIASLGGYVSIPVGHKIYARGYIENVTKGTSDIIPHNMYIGEDFVYSRNAIVTNKTDNITPSISIKADSYEENDIIGFKLECFDLTEDFGAGKEPTDITFCQQYYGADYITNGKHYKHTDYYAMNGRNNETEVIG